MGRTLATTNQTILNEIAHFRNFRRALRPADQARLDTLFAAARQHTAAISLADHALPFEAILLAMLLDQQRRIEQLESERIEREREEEEEAGCVFSLFLLL